MQDEHIVVSRVARTIDQFARNIGAIGTVIFTAMIIYVVVCRYFLEFTPRWSEELPRLFLVWVTFIGAISATVRNSHLCAGLTNLVKMPSSVREAIRKLAVLSTLLFFGVLVVSGLELTMVTWSHETTVLSWPAGLVYLALPATSLLSILALICMELRK
jgi:TRAP-type C4-dicarboxylate transport system permease small subunit